MKPNGNSARHALSSLVVLSAILVGGVAGSCFLYSFSHNIEKERASDDFALRAAGRHALLSESLHGYRECVYSLRNLFTNSDDVSLKEFTSCSLDIRSRHPGIQAVQWIPVVPQERRAEVEAWARREISPDFAFKERTSDGRLVPATARPFYRPILYTDPMTGNEAALGYDILSRPTQGDMERALKTRDVVVTRKIQLVQTAPGSDNTGVIMVAPVYQDRGGREELIGFAQIVFRLDQMLAQSWVNYPGTVLDALFLDTTEPMQNEVLFARRSPSSLAPDAPISSPSDLGDGPFYHAKLELGGRSWSCYYAPTAGWLQARTSPTPILLLISGLAFTAVLGAYFVSIRRRSAQIERLVNERTAELRHTQILLENDIAKRQSVEAELRENRRQLDSLLGQMPGVAYRCAHDTNPPRALFISEGANDIIGYSPQNITSGKVSYADFIHHEDLPLRETAIAKAIADKSTFECEYRVIDSRGRLKWLLDRGQGIYSPDGAFLFLEGLAIDITGRKQAEADRVAIERKLLETQKLESLGVLAGGIAHDFNNLLTTIVGHASIARLDMPATAPLQANLEQIELGARRAAELCQQMLAYAGKGRFHVQRVRLDTLVRETTPLLEHSINKRATLRFVFDPNSPTVEVDATQIRQIIMNLVVNASDAIGDHDGEIVVETFTMKRNDPRLTDPVLPPPLETEEFACLSVRDTGVGMDAQTVRKIFEPFFTTKFAGRGLGLAAVLGIVRSHHGSLLVTSNPGAGSTFTLLLPAATGSTSETLGTPSPLSRPQASIGTALLIDDEKGVRDVAAQMFRSVGLRSLTAADGVEGLEVFHAHREHIKIVLLDLTMPRLSGQETFLKLREVAPDLPIILTSGYNDIEVPELGADPRLLFLQKPFSLGQLHAQIAKLVG